MSDRFEPAAPGLHVRKVRPCDACGKPLAKREGEPPMLNAYRIRIDSLILDQRVVNSLGGLTLFFQGHAGLAEVFAPDVDVYKCFARDDELLICFTCYELQSLGSIAEVARRRRELAAEAEKTGQGAASPDSQADGHRDPDPESQETQ